MSVKETAEAILAGDYDLVCEVIDGSQKVQHLQAMAKLWMKMRELSETNPAIFDIMKQADLVDSTPNQP